MLCDDGVSLFLGGLSVYRGRPGVSKDLLTAVDTMMSTLVPEPAAQSDPSSPENPATVPMLEALRTMAVDGLTEAALKLEDRDACQSSLKRIHRLQRKWGRTPVEMAHPTREDRPCAVRSPSRQASVEVTLTVTAAVTEPAVLSSPSIPRELSFVSVWVDTVAGLERAKSDITAAAAAASGPRGSDARVGAGIDCEWRDPIEHCSLLQIAVGGTAWVIDTSESRHTDPKYGAALLAFGVWFFTFDAVARLGFGFRSDVRKIGCLLHKLTGMHGCDGAGVRDNNGSGGDGSDGGGAEGADSRGDTAVPANTRLIDANAGLQQTLDIQLVSQRVLGARDSPSLAAVANRMLGLTLDKTEQRSDWETRPLSETQLRYAGMDAWVLIGLDAALHRAPASP